MMNIMKRCVETAILSTALLQGIGVACAGGGVQVIVMENPNKPGGLADGVPSLSTLISSQGSNSWSYVFSGGPTWATSLTISNWVFEYTSSFEALAEGFRLEVGDSASAADLGFAEEQGFPYGGMLAAFFAAYPCHDYAVAWCGGSFESCGSAAAVSASYTVTALSSPPQLMGPDGRCAPGEQHVVSFTLAGSPSLRSGVQGFRYKGAVTQNKVCIHVSEGGDGSAEFGHGFLSLSADGLPATRHGFYPTVWGPFLVVIPVPGYFRDEIGVPWSRGLCYLLPTSQYNAVSSYVAQSRASRPWYDLTSFSLALLPNCTSWALGGLAAGGLDWPNARSFGVFYDPRALNASLAKLGEELFDNCGKLVLGPALLDVGPLPISYSFSGVLLFAVESPEELAASMKAVFLDSGEQAITVSPGGTITLSFVDPSDGGFAALIDWGDGELTVVTEPQSISRSGKVASTQIRVGVIEQGSIQRSVFVLDVAESAPNEAEMVVTVTATQPVSFPNGPFDPSPIPVFVNSNCVDAVPVPVGTLPFTNLAGSTSGPPELASCPAGGGGQFFRDVWFVHQSECSGEVTFSLCGSTLMTRLAVYANACPQGSGEVVACDIGSCVDNRSRVTLKADAGQVFYVRVGSLLNQVGDGVLTVDCVSSAVGDLNGDGVVDGADLGILLSSWGPCDACPADLNGDGVVDGADLGILLSAWTF